MNLIFSGVKLHWVFEGADYTTRQRSVNASCRKVTRMLVVQRFILRRRHCIITQAIVIFFGACSGVFFGKVTVRTPSWKLALTSSG